MKITFKTRSQAAIFRNEIQGQISDGAWENDSRSQWRYWSNADVFVGENSGCVGAPGRRGFALHTLIEYVGSRMISFAKIAIAFPDLDIDDLNKVEYFNTPTDTLAKWAKSNGYYADVLKHFCKIAGDVGCTAPTYLALAAVGQSLVAERMAQVDYTEKDLRADLTEIKKTMKKNQRDDLTFLTERAIGRLADGSELTAQDRRLLLDWMPMPDDRQEVSA